MAFEQCFLAVLLAISLWCMILSMLLLSGRPVVALM